MDVSKTKPNIDSAEKQAIFRLGQMDFQQSAVAYLQKMAESTLGISRSTLLIAADLVKKMEVMK